MTLRYKICLVAVKLFEDYGIKVDRVELLFPSTPPPPPSFSCWGILGKIG